MKQRSSRYIHYSEPNQEPIEHIKAKERIKHILYNFDYVLVTNTNDEHNEFRLPELVTKFIAETEKESVRQYQIDLLMYSSLAKKMIAIEVHGGYHYASKRKIAAMRLKEETINDYLASHDNLTIKKSKYTQNYPYLTYKVLSFRTEEIYGKNSMDRLQIIDKILN